MLKGILNKYNESCAQGLASIKRFQIDQKGAQLHNMQVIFNGGNYFQMVHEGEYVKLYVDGELMMSDTHMERITNEEFVNKAHGSVMIAGLGLGLIIENLRDKVASGEVTNIVVYEKYQDVIDMVAPRFSDFPLQVRLQDILEYKPVKGEKYDTLYFDIWATIEEDNLQQMSMLHHRWKNHKNKGGWMGSWMQDYLRNQRRRSQRSSYYY